MVDWDQDTISIRRQCELLGVSRASLYYTPLGENEENLQLMRWIDEQYTATPFFGSRRMAAWLASGTAERDAALEMIDRIEGSQPITVAADKAYDTADS